MDRNLAVWLVNNTVVVIVVVVLVRPREGKQAEPWVTLSATRFSLQQWVYQTTQWAGNSWSTISV